MEYYQVQTPASTSSAKAEQPAAVQDDLEIDAAQGGRDKVRCIHLSALCDVWRYRHTAAQSTSDSCECPYPLLVSVTEFSGFPFVVTIASILVQLISGPGTHTRPPPLSLQQCD